MFAVIRTGGKQYRVAPDQLVTVERLDAEPGASVTIEDVLMVGGDGAVKIGTPVLAGASVTAEVVEQTRGPKVIIFKKKRRQNYRRKKGHRQDLTVLKITAIAGA
ncbi:50S ribosomal protein L21 [Inquilinus limosus]|jgi:large subunit ribosomal protein L21|uniref:Large ribosomal subunit protein bL21 n=2 Tax=Inquilinus limosus TaxID=171674 RepID=A0A211ZT52_9PROT|nr:50S ribosomal protein L21 [Inquilinus limosus]KGM32394.1 50S ribosomal protein L21 [Inquilinus limosus MP06]OWJ68468.1 50S ribosomal protein L21 [Inquilinus limosus]